jgi:hypothetical protein
MSTAPPELVIAEMMTLVSLASDVLDHACPTDEGQRRLEGILHIETHCVGFTVTARKTEGRWEISVLEQEGRVTDFLSWN